MFEYKYIKYVENKYQRNGGQNTVRGKWDISERKIKKGVSE